MKYLINIIGPTAVGKTALAIQVAKHFNTEIISSDSRQFYKEVSIGTAKPSELELSEVRHHFISTVSVAEKYNAGDFEREVIPFTQEFFKAHDVLVMVGGSGLYIKAITDGLDQLPEGNEMLRTELRNLYEEKGIEALHERLKNMNPVLFETTEKKNPQRLMRAIEIEEGGSKVTVKKVRNFKTITIGLNLPRPLLYNRINERVDHMMEAGLLDEVTRMLPYKEAYAMQTVGYKELFQYLEGEITLEKAVDQIKQHTRNYAKRQITWFRNNGEVAWFEPHQVQEIIRYIESGILI